jgi:hypothetical protein
MKLAPAAFAVAPEAALDSMRKVIITASMMRITAR